MTINILQNKVVASLVATFSILLLFSYSNELFANQQFKERPIFPQSSKKRPDFQLTEYTNIRDVFTQDNTPYYKLDYDSLPNLKTLGNLPLGTHLYVQSEFNHDYLTVTYESGKNKNEWIVVKKENVSFLCARQLSKNFDVDAFYKEYSQNQKNMTDYQLKEWKLKATQKLKHSTIEFRAKVLNLNIRSAFKTHEVAFLQLESSSGNVKLNVSIGDPSSVERSKLLRKNSFVTIIGYVKSFNLYLYASEFNVVGGIVPE